nr:hypothetical protein [uncultured Undibacterium sp.]
MRLINSIRSGIAALKASAVFGRALRRQREGKLTEALVIAQNGLAILRHTYVEHSNPSEGSAHASLTVLAESIAWDLDVPGVTALDLSTALVFLKAIHTENQPSGLSEYIPFLESRLESLHKHPHTSA